MKRRLINRPDLPFTGLNQMYKIALDPWIVLGVIVLMAVAIAIPLTAVQAQFLVFLIVPAVVLRGRRAAR